MCVCVCVCVWVCVCYSRHNSVVRLLAAFLQARLPSSTVVADLDDEYNWPEQYLGPRGMQRPDIVVLNDEKPPTKCWLYECTITWLSDPVRSHGIKLAKYQGLVEAINKRGLAIQYKPFEVTSLGLVLPTLCNIAEACPTSRQLRDSLYKDIAAAAIAGSMAVWQQRNGPLPQR